jgi:DNA-binding GntR family transcriptional regulator
LRSFDRTHGEPAYNVLLHYQAEKLLQQRGNDRRRLSRMHPATRLKAVQQKHRTVFDAIRARDPERAYAVMRIHVEKDCLRIFEGQKRQKREEAISSD